jgi:hypothetical protein
MSLSAVENRNYTEQSDPPGRPADLDSIDDTPDAPVQDATTTDVPATYVSDAELLAWLQAKSAGQYGELDQLMDASNERSELIKDLANLKEKLDNMAADPKAALAAVESMRAEYAGTPLEADVEALLSPYVKPLEDYAGFLDSLKARPEVEEEFRETVAKVDEEIKKQYLAKIPKSGSIDATIKDLEHDDQIALVQIQALMSEIRETAQLTSNIIANRSQTSDSIVGNIRA